MGLTDKEIEVIQLMRIYLNFAVSNFSPKYYIGRASTLIIEVRRLKMHDKVMTTIVNDLRDAINKITEQNEKMSNLDENSVRVKTIYGYQTFTQI